MWKVNYWRRFLEWDERALPVVATGDGTEIPMPMFVGHPGEYDPKADALAYAIVEAMNAKGRIEALQQDMVVREREKVRQQEERERLLALKREHEDREIAVWQAHYQSLKTTAATDLAEAVSDLLFEKKHELLDEDEVASAIAETNAGDFDVEVDVTSVKEDDKEFVARLDIYLRGKQDEDRMCCGTLIRGSAEFVIDSTGGARFRDVEAEVDYDEAGDFEPEYDDEPPYSDVPEEPEERGNDLDW